MTFQAVYLSKYIPVLYCKKSNTFVTYKYWKDVQEHISFTIGQSQAVEYLGKIVL